MSHTAALTADCPALRYPGKFADIAALNSGETAQLRPVFDRRALRHTATGTGVGREVALVLGANGFVGAHLIAELSRRPGIRKVYAAVRRTADVAGLARLRTTLSQYRVDNVDLDKVVVTAADLTQCQFGLPDPDYARLLDETDLVFSCAGSIDYTKSYLELRNDRVLSLLRVLQFSVERRPKHLTYLGSIGASCYREHADFHRPDSWWYSGYSQMNWVNGALVGGLFDSEDFRVTLCEAPQILGSTTIGLDPGRHYSWWRLVELAVSAGAIWDGPGMNYVPVDVLTEVLVTNAVAAEPLKYLLPRNPIGYHNEIFADLLGLEMLEWAEFVQLVSSRVSPGYQNTLLSSDVDALVRVINEADPVIPPGQDMSWCENRRLFRMYLQNNDIRLASRWIA
jgi:thioester reductase-like protein